jgi:hypothetical protein
MGSTATLRLTSEIRALYVIYVLNEAKRQTDYPPFQEGLTTEQICERIRKQFSIELHRNEIRKAIKDINSWKYMFGSNRAVIIIEKTKKALRKNIPYWKLRNNIDMYVWDEIIRELVSIISFKYGYLEFLEKFIKDNKAKENMFSSLIILFQCFETNRTANVMLDEECRIIYPSELFFNFGLKLKYFFVDISSGTPKIDENEQCHLLTHFKSITTGPYKRNSEGRLIRLSNSPI